MLELRYPFTNADLARWHRLNKTVTMQPWRSYLLVTLALLPSTAWLIYSGAFYASIWMSVATLVMLLYAGWHFFAAGHGNADGYPCIERLTDDAKLSRFSKSFAQTKWHRFEDFRETTEDFQFWRLDRCSLIPKQPLSETQVSETREFVQRVRNLTAGDSGPLPGYSETILTDSPHPIYRYHYTAEDMRRMLQSRFVAYDGRSTGHSVGRSSTHGTNVPLWRRVLRVAGLTALAVALLILSVAPGRGLSGELFRQFLICLLPFALLLAWARVSMFLRRRQTMKVPPDEIEMRVSNDGVAFGDADAIVFYHWTDVQGVYVNADFIGLRTINQLINVLPQRVIGDAAAVEQFIELMLDLKRNCVSDAPTAGSSDALSDNPYQPPAV